MARDSGFSLRGFATVDLRGDSFSHFPVSCDCLRVIQFSGLVHCNTGIFIDLTVQWQLDCWWFRDVPAGGCWHISGCAPAGCRGGHREQLMLLKQLVRLLQPVQRLLQPPRLQVDLLGAAATDHKPRWIGRN